MQSDERLERVQVLREQGRTPKEIARALGIKPSEASRLVRSAAILAQAQAPEPPLAGCWISPNWSTGLAFGDHPDWPVHEDPPTGSDGLVAVLIARRHRHDKVSVCGYLADVYCLGVKNAMGPEIMDEFDLRGFARRYFSGFDSGPLEAPIELARQLVHGCVEYARGLGFEPHPDFAAAEGHLGAWTPPGTITFGRDGKPTYVSGPYDNPSPIIRTLERTVGTGHFDFVAAIG